MKTHRRTTKKTSLLPLVLLFLLISTVSLANVANVDGVGVDATAYAKGLLTPTQWDCLVAASYVGVEEQIYMPKELDGVQGFPTDVDDDSYYFVVISSGDAVEYKGKATDFASHYTRGPTAENLPPWFMPPPVGWDLSYDIARLSVSLEIPAGASILSFDWKFATEELPDEPRWTTQRDWAIATVTTSAGTENILLLPNREPVDIFPAYRFFNKVRGSHIVPDWPYPEPNDVVFNAVTPIHTAWFDVRPYLGETIHLDFWVGDHSDGYRDSALFLDNLRFGPATGNLQALDIVEIQTVPADYLMHTDYLITGKPTAFNITYFSSFTHVVLTEVQLDLHNFNLPSYTIRLELNPGLNYYYVARPWSGLFPTGKDYWAQVKLDPKNWIPETDEHDNRAITQWRSAYTIYPHDGYLDLLFVRLHHANEPPRDQITEAALRIDIRGAEDFMRATYPLAPYNIRCRVRPTPLKVGDDWDWEDILDKLADMGSAYNRIVGVANDTWIGWYANNLFGFLIRGLTDEGRCVMVMGLENNAEIIAHEIAHTYGLGDDYRGGSDGLGRKICEKGSGYWVDRRQERINRNTFMHINSLNPWVSSTDYNALRRRFWRSWLRDPEVLLISGAVFRDGTAELSRRLHRAFADEADIAAGSVGNFYIALRDELGNTLSRVGFNATFNLASDPPREVDKAHFSFTIEWASGTRLIQLQDAEGNVLTTRDVSPNPPSVDVNSPNGGEALTPGTDYTITWSAMDPDGDPLTYNVLVSNGVDAKPVPIATGLDQTSFTYDFTNLPGGDQYRIHVEANDGVNVNSDVSDDFFTVTFFTIDVITQPQSIHEGGKATYTLNVSSYGGFSDPVTLNAESPTAPALTFQWPDGATITPIPSGSITVSMEVQVPAGTDGGYHALIVSGVAIKDPQVTITYLFVLSHDIAIIETTISKTAVNPGDIISTNITVQNQGAFNEVFDVTVYYDTHIIEEQWAYLHAGESKALTFIWNTTGVASGKYTISAYATPIPDETDIRAPSRETDTADNIFIGDTVVIQPPVNIWLLVIVASAAVIIALVSCAAILRWRRKR